MTHVGVDRGVGSAAGDAFSSVEVRPLRTHAEFAACVELQRLTWGGDYTDVVPASLLKVVPKVGGWWPARSRKTAACSGSCSA